MMMMMVGGGRISGLVTFNVILDKWEVCNPYLPFANCHEPWWSVGERKYYCGYENVTFSPCGFQIPPGGDQHFDEHYCCCGAHRRHEPCYIQNGICIDVYAAFRTRIEARRRRMMRIEADLSRRYGRYAFIVAAILSVALAVMSYHYFRCGASIRDIAEPIILGVLVGVPMVWTMSIWPSRLLCVMWIVAVVVAYGVCFGKELLDGAVVVRQSTVVGVRVKKSCMRTLRLRAPIQ